MTTIKWILFTLVFSNVSFSTTFAITTINLGILLPRVTDENLATGLIVATEIAIKRVQEVGGLLPRSDYVINYTEINTVCNELKAVELVYKYRHLDAFIGPACSKECTSSGLLATTLNKPMISYSCSSLELSNRALYPTFARTRPYTRTYTTLTPLMIYELLKFRNWKRSCIISTEDEIWAPLATTIKQVLLNDNMTVPYTGFYTPNSKLDYKTVLLPVTKTCRIITFLAFSEEVAKLLWTADQMGLRNGEYAFITLDFNIESRYKNGSWHVPRDELFATFDGIIDLAVGEPEGPKYNETITELKTAMLNKSMRIIQQTLTFGIFIIDTITLYAYGVNKTIENNGSYTDGKALISELSIKKRLFTGLSGDVGINTNGNRIPVFVFSNRKNGKMVPSVMFDIHKTPGDPEYMKVLNNTQIVWPGGSTVVPSDEPPCGFDGEKCVKVEPGLSNWYYALLIIPVLLIVLLAGFLYYRKNLYEKDLENSTWLVPYRDLTFLASDNRFSSRVRSRASLASSLGLGQYAASINVGRYRGELVVIKKLRKESVNLSREVLIDMKKARDTHHANLNPYIGVCVESPDICTVSLFCNRGSLQDLLANDDIKLEWMFRQSFANDIVTGMEALHNSAVHVHGNLKSSNCLVDSRWVCRIGDYGLRLFNEGQSEKDCGEHAKYRDLLWTAPELLQKEEGDTRKFSKVSISSRPQSKHTSNSFSQSGDVYSFGIILYELVTRDEPYTSNTGTILTPKEIIDQVTSHQIPPFRPQFPKSVLDLDDQRIIHCVYECWDDDPARRPHFSAVKKKLKMLNKGKNTNIVDNMIAMMEKYTDQLEDLVEERTKQLAEEKAKTDELLYKMLPKPIADQLKRGNTVAAESFKSVTIFFSDIVGFTSVAAQSTPLQVVDLLNALYTCFDNVVDNHDVYKVETIGDAYMIVSGLPVRNENRHAGEIATTALDLLSAVRDFQIPHIPSKKVQLRIGVHTGPCVAGVVGLKMPRYCLFGDTVNYASRMESSGLALRIHVSPECREVLEELGGYHLQERGPVTMKGKGTIVTYFLLGKDGFDKPLPDLHDAASAAEHEFK